ncbi:MAG: exo-alpha-sialidase [Lachnospira sp.]|nr:exo-alpha-sialidase [Lachnospira sp.]
MKLDKKVVNALAQVGLALAVVIAVVIASYANYADKMQSKIQLKSRYTFTVCIDESGNVVDRQDAASSDEDDDSVTVGSSATEQFTGVGIGKIGDVWIKEYLAQYTQRFLSATKSLRQIQIDETSVLDEANNTVLIGFSAKLLDSTTEYFSSWEGILDEGRLRCEWVVRFDIDNHYDGTATIYVDSMLTPEDYGIYQYNESMKENNSSGDQTEENKDSLTGYTIKDSTLYITYDGGETYTAVPVAYDNLFINDDEGVSLKAGSYMISTTKTAVLYGGKSEENGDVPVTLLYTDNMGEDWITCEIDRIYNADYMYVEFFGENLGVIVVGYDKTEMYESSRIYSTTDGGVTWNNVGTGPTTGIIKGVKFIDENNGFVCYKYADGMDSNIYLTRDGGKTFSKIIFEAQKLEGVSSDSGLTWNHVFKEAQIPSYNSKGALIINISQGENAIFNNGSTVARYQSHDKGRTWEYIGQYEMNSGT